MQKVLISWSGGKDCALALHDVLASQEYRVVGLLTTITGNCDRLAMHDVRCSLLERQAESLGLPLEMVSISSHTSNADYEANLVQALRRYKESGVTSVVFGDIFREDLRKYRVLNLARLGLKGIFPLWKRKDFQIMESIISLGFKAIVVSINTRALGDQFIGRVIDWSFMFDYPRTADVCGEHGEYHTFVYDGPTFKRCLSFQVGETFSRDDHFKYCDLIPN
ncbi:MAG TPA: diphthine--ammonia ligase [Anaerolineales bacterium]|nr:diphthine--ammonia ligase [Anaerolineales bacterium]